MTDDPNIEKSIHHTLYDYNQWRYNEHMTFTSGDLVTLRNVNLTTREKINKIYIFDAPDVPDNRDSSGWPTSKRVGTWNPGDIGVILEGVCVESGQIEVFVNETFGWADFEFLKLCESK